MELPISLCDVFSTTLPIQEACLLAQCCKQVNELVTKSKQIIIKNDNTTPLLVLTKCLNPDDVQITPEHMLVTKTSLNKKDSLLYVKLLKSSHFHYNNMLQDYVISRIIFHPAHKPEEVNSQMISLFSACLLSFDTECYTASQKYAAFTFITRALVKYIIWVIENNQQDNKDLCLFQSRSFACSFLNKIYYFNYTNHLMMIPEQQRSHVSQYLKSIMKYIVALKSKTYAGQKMHLFIGPKGGIYKISKNRKQYFK